MTGWAPAVSEEQRAALTDLLAHVPLPDQLRDAVALTNREASAKEEDTVSKECIVATLSPDGSGQIMVYGNLPKEFLPSVRACPELRGIWVTIHGDSRRRHRRCRCRGGRVA